MKNKPWANVGDVVVCTKSGGDSMFTVGKEYNVESIDNFGWPNFRDNEGWMSERTGYPRIGGLWSFEVKK